MVHCPTCQKPMSRGYARLGYTFWGWVRAGLSRLSLFFNIPGKPEINLLGIHDRRLAYLCETCGTLILERAHAWKCPGCGSMVPADAAHCATCGPDEPTRRCPICRAEVPIALASCPYCAGPESAVRP